MSIWELLSHFEDGETDFGRCKGWIRKLRHCEVLEHPVAEQLDAVGVGPHVPREHRFPWLEREAGYAVIRIFDAARTALEVHRASFRDSEGHLRSVKDSGVAAMRELARLEEDHRVFFSKVVEGLKAKFLELQRDMRKEESMTDREFFLHIDAEALRIAKTATSPTIANLEERALDLSFARTGYVVESALQYLRTGRNLDSNDYVDELLCGHLDLKSERILVTADKWLYGALSRADLRLRRQSTARGQRERSSPLVIHQRVFDALVRTGETTMATDK